MIEKEKNLLQERFFKGIMKTTYIAMPQKSLAPVISCNGYNHENRQMGWKFIFKLILCT